MKKLFSKSKVAIVTGGNQGIGFGISKCLLEKGFKVAIFGIDPKVMDEAIKKLVKMKFEKSNIFAAICDVSSEENWNKAVNKVMKKWGKIDALVNNAGILVQKPIAETTMEDMEKVLHTNLIGSFLGIKVCSKKMKKGSAIVNIASVAGLKGFPDLSAYCSSKFGLIGLTKVAALELASKGIRVNVVCPGLIDTPMTKDLMSQKAVKEAYLNSIPLHRAGTPEDIGHMVALLADENSSSYCTGGAYVVDGGMIA